MSFSNDFESYIKQFPLQTQELLKEMRIIIQKSAPQATECFKYGMPTFFLHVNLVHFAAYKNHIGFYPTPSVIIHFKEELTKYKTSKGAIQFPLKKLPKTLITKIVKYRFLEVKHKFL